MKKIFFILLMLFFMAGVTNAQVKQNKESTKTQQNQKQKKPYGAKTKKTGNTQRDNLNKGGTMDSTYNTNPGDTASLSGGKGDTTNHTNIYKSPATGQRATPTGQEATGTNSTNSNNPKNAGTNPGSGNAGNRNSGSGNAGGGNNSNSGSTGGGR